MDVEMRSEDDSQPASEAAENDDDIDGEDSAENEGKNEKVDGGSDSDDDDDDDDDSEADQEEYFIKLQEINKDEFNYELYKQLTEIAHKSGDLDKIRESYERFAARFPLAPSIWLKYLSVEQSLAQSEQEIEAVNRHFRKALTDYYDFDVALAFANFIMEHPSPETDKIWDELLTVYALPCKRGREIFQLWRKYHESTYNAPDKKEKIVKMYKKELSIPLENMEDSYIEFKVFCTKNEIKIDWDEIDEMYQDTKKCLEDILPFENELSDLNEKSEEEKYDIYNSYIKNAFDMVDENVYQTIFERMVTETCLHPQSWIDYTEYLHERGKKKKSTLIEDLKEYPVFKQTSIDIVDRGIKNCVWYHELHIRKMHILEDLRLPKADVQTAFEDGLKSGLQSPDQEVSLWIEYLSYLRRNTNMSDEKEAEILTLCCSLAWDTLGRNWGSAADPTCEILMFWGRLEYCLDNSAEGRQLWTTALGHANNFTKSGLWIELATLEAEFDVEETRNIFKLALQQPLDDLTVMVSAWIRFERVYGRLDQLKACQKICEETLKSYFEDALVEEPRKRKKQDNRKRKISDQNAPDPSKVKTETKKAKTTPTTRETERNKDTSRDRTEHNHDDHLEVDTAKDHLTVFLSNLDYNVTEEEIRLAFPELSIQKIDLVKAANGRGRGFGYMLLNAEDDVTKAISFDLRPVNNRPVFISSVIRDKDKRGKFKYSEGLEPTKLFVKGLPPDAEREELEELFGQFGEVKDVRIVHHKSGKSKGIAYIEYCEEKSASTAVLKLDKQSFKDHELTVAISAPPPREQAKSQVKFKSLFGQSFKAQAAKATNQKPRMNLIPTAVRRNVLNEAKEIPGTSTVVRQTEPKKTNEDFRKMLLKQD